MFRNLCYKIGDLLIKRKVGKYHPKERLLQLTPQDKVLVLWVPEREQEEAKLLKELKELCKERAIDMDIIAYSESVSPIPLLDVLPISSMDFNCWGFPKKEALKGAMKNHYDCLFFWGRDADRNIHHLLQLYQIPLKVGIFNTLGPLNILFKTDTKNRTYSPRFFLEQIKKHLLA